MPGQTLAQTEAAKVAARGGAPAQQEAQPASLAILGHYWPKLKVMLPQHIVPEAWYASAFAALYKNPQLQEFADANPESLMFALMDCAGLGLTPGTKEYYLTPRPNRKAKGGREVLGIQGYVGVIERMYRAGAVTQVVVEVVRKNDEFRYSRAQGDDIPYHEFDPMARRADRGELIGVYAYARMVTGNWSTPVVLNQDDIDRSMSASPTSKSEYSPWKTDTEAMWKKTAVHRLENWVPTSSNYVLHQQKAMLAKAEIQTKAAAGLLTAQPAAPALPAAPPPEPTPLSAPAASDPGDTPVGDFRPPAGYAPDLGGDEGYSGELDPSSMPDDEPAPAGGFEPATQNQHKRVMSLLGRRVADDAHRHAMWTALTGRPITSQSQVSTTEADTVYETLKAWGRAGELDRRISAMVPAQGEAPPSITEEDGEKLPEPRTVAWHEAGHPLVDGGQVTRVPKLLNGECGPCEEIADAEVAEALAAAGAAGDTADA